MPDERIVVKLPEIVLGIVRNEDGVPTHLAIQTTMFYDAEAAIQLAHGIEDVADHMVAEQRKAAKERTSVGDVTD